MAVGIDVERCDRFFRAQGEMVNGHLRISLARFLKSLSNFRQRLVGMHHGWAHEFTHRHRELSTISANINNHARPQALLPQSPHHSEGSTREYWPLSSTSDSIIQHTYDGPNCHRGTIAVWSS